MLFTKPKRRKVALIMTLMFLLNLFTTLPQVWATAPVLNNLKVDGRYATDKMYVWSGNVDITGNCGVGNYVVINGVNVTSDSSGDFTYNVTLNPGQNKFSIIARNTTSEMSKTLSILYDDGRPFVYDAVYSDIVYTSSVNVGGSVYRTTSLTINGQATTITNNAFSKTITGLTPGSNDIQITATDSSTGLDTTYDYYVYYEDGPGVTVTSPDNYYSAPTNTVTISGTVNQNTTSLKMKLNSGSDQTVSFGTSKTFSTTVTLSTGLNEITFTAGNLSRSVTKKWYITYSKSPELYITAPTDNETVTSSTYTVAGRVYNTITGGLKVNGTAVTFDSKGYFSKSVSLSTGTNKVVVTATDGSATVTKNVYLYFDYTPIITVTSPATDPYSSKSSTITVAGKVKNATSLRINGSAVTIKSDGSFSTTVTLKNSESTITITASNNSGFSNTKELTVSYGGKPALTVTSPRDGSSVTSSTLTVKGTVFPTDGLEAFTVTHNNEVTDISQDSNGKFSEDIELKEGDNKLKFTVVAGGQTLTKEISVKYENYPELTVDDTLMDRMTVFTNELEITGEVDSTIPVNGLKINNTVVTFDSDGTFTKTVILKPGENKITISAARNSKTTTKTYIVFYNDFAKQEAQAIFNLKKGEKVTAFGEFLTIQPSKSDYAENRLVITAISPNDTGAGPVSTSFVGPIFDLSFENNPLTAFTLTLTYDDVIKASQAYKVSAAYYDDNQGGWVILGGQVNADDKTVTVSTDKPGKYAAIISYKTFNDITIHWGRRNIEFLVARGVASGVSEGQFCPDLPISRASFTVFLAKACGLKPYEPTVASFTDVYSGDWFFPWVEAAARAGIVFGVRADSFAPYESITREQAAIMIARAANLELVDEDTARQVLGNFSDRRFISSYADIEVASVVDAGLMQGMGANKFKPQGITTRAQAAAMIVNLMAFNAAQEE